MPPAPTLSHSPTIQRPPRKSSSISGKNVTVSGYIKHSDDSKPYLALKSESGSTVTADAILEIDVGYNTWQMFSISFDYSAKNIDNCYLMVCSRNSSNPSVGIIRLDEIEVNGWKLGL